MISADKKKSKTSYTELLPEIKQVYNSVKIKQEKLTPPSSPPHNPTTSSETNLVTTKQRKNSIEHILGESVFASLAEPNDDKKNIELTKSSEELLAELFQAFNSAPPFLVDETKTSKKAKKKHKKEKKKKHKKKGRSSNDEENVDENVDKRLKKKKRKKVKKDKLLDGNNGSKTEKEKSKKRKSEDSKLTTKRKKRKKQNEVVEGPKDDLDIVKYEQELLAKIRREEKLDGKSKSKIIIKSLKNSAVYKANVDKAEKRKEKERKNGKHDDAEYESDQSKSSEISLSDEETYERNRSHFYERDFYYGYRSRDDYYKERSPRSRDRYEPTYYGHGYRGLGSRYDDRDMERRR